MYIIDNKRCGIRIRQLRVQAGLSQEALAQQLRITNIHLSRIENGARGASLDVMLDISSVFGVSIDYLLTGRIIFDNPEVKARLQGIIDELTELKDKISE